jgi:hypothetical protein
MIGLVSHMAVTGSDAVKVVREAYIAAGGRGEDVQNTPKQSDAAGRPPEWIVTVLVGGKVNFVSVDRASGKIAFDWNRILG